MNAFEIAALVVGGLVGVGAVLAGRWADRRAERAGKRLRRGGPTPRYPADLYPGCPCGECLTAVGGEWRMWLCPECGSKRCPGAIHHDRHGEQR
ncbi:hypothetical protein [Rhodococcus opacus]|uniref:hypothetical protein n=1 Tax=Rhodococcus opacus TaxID=37919 RepID=UPI000A9E3201|nr:hypothetical protein [Rhodococcus opacus]